MQETYWFAGGRIRHKFTIYPHTNLSALGWSIQISSKVAPSALRDQIFRAADSVVLNIAEGAGRHTRADKRRHYSYALGSAMECGAALALLHARGALREIAYQERRMMIIRVIQMLYRLAGPPR